MDIKSILVKGIANKLFSNIKPEQFNSKNDYIKYIEWVTGRYFNFIDDKIIRSIRLEMIKDILKSAGINFKESSVIIGYNMVNQIELI